MKNSNIYSEIKNKLYNYSPTDIVGLLGFDEAILLARDMLNNDAWDEALQERAVALLEEIRKTYLQRWEANWCYDALLGYAYDIILNYDERYEAYKRAMNKVNPAPPQLLVALAGCCIAPGRPQIREQEAIILVKKAIRETQYIEAVELLISLCKSIGDSKERKHWECILEKIKDTGVHLPSLDQLPEP